VRDALALIDVRLLDHLIVAGPSVLSFCRKGAAVSPSGPYSMVACPSPSAALSLGIERFSPLCPEASS
jgi:hypothetical protein